LENVSETGLISCGSLFLPPFGHHNGTNIYHFRAYLLTAPTRGTQPTGIVLISAEEGGDGMGTHPLDDAHFTAQATLGTTLQ